MKKKFILLVSLVLCLQISNAQEATSQIDSKIRESQVVLDTPEIIEEVYWSEYVLDEFKIFISLPKNYNGSRVEKYPVVYFLDGGSPTFHTITYEFMQAKTIPEVITIGIGYPGATQRNRDYTYGFANFYQFLNLELIPQMDLAFNIDPMKRTLFGHSFGGICVLFTMFKYDDYNNIPFHNLIAASPSIWWPNGYEAFSREDALYNETSILPVNFYMTVGSLEGSMVDDFNRMKDVLESRNYENFNSSYHVNFDKDHSTNKELSFREGIKWVLNQAIQIHDEGPSAIPEKNQVEATVWPNPTEDILKVRLGNPNPGNCKIELMNSYGNAVFTEVTSNPDFMIKVFGFPKGCYLLKIDGNKIHSSSKIVVN